MLLMIKCFLGLSFLGWVSLIYGLVSSRRFRRKREKETVPAQAAFVAYQASVRKAGYYGTRTVYQPILRFMAGARQYQVTSSYYHEKETLAPGDAVSIFYDPDDPARFHLEEETDEMGAGMRRIGKIIIAAAAVISVICRIFVFS